MSTSNQTAEAHTSGIYVYGIVPADVEAEDDAVGVAEGKVGTIAHGEIAALVSDLSIDRPLGAPEDLRAHARLLDGTAQVAPVLPLRFGAVLTDADAVKQEFLAEHAEQFAAALKQLEGKAEYVVKGRYVEKAILQEVIDENADASQLRDVIRDKPEDATRDARMALGELVSNAVAAKREEDTRRAVEAVDGVAESVNLREPTHEQDAVNAALLVETSREDQLEEAVDGLARDWEGRVDVRLLGPIAPYDFVVTQRPEG